MYSHVGYCRKNCFTDPHFKGCLDALELKSDAEVDPIKALVKKFNGVDITPLIISYQSICPES